MKLGGLTATSRLTLTQCRECLGKKRRERIAKDPAKHRDRQRVNSLRYRKKAGQEVFGGSQGMSDRNLKIENQHLRAQVAQVRKTWKELAEKLIFDFEVSVTHSLTPSEYFLASFFRYRSELTLLPVPVFGLGPLRCVHGVFLPKHSRHWVRVSREVGS